MKWWLIAPLASVSLFACSEETTKIQDESTSKSTSEDVPKNETYTLTYFNMPGWPLCAKVVPIVNGLEETYGDKMTFEVKIHNEGNSQELIKKYELGKHGMVITDSTGKSLWSEPGHNQTKEEIDKAIMGVLGT